MNAVAFGEHDVELVGVGERRFAVVQQLEQVLSRVGAFDVEEKITVVVVGGGVGGCGWALGSVEEEGLVWRVRGARLAVRSERRPLC